MKRHYATFDQSKLLKKKGFNEYCNNCYNIRGQQYVDGWCNYIDDDDIIVPFNNSFLKQEDTLAPEQHMVVEWLRVNHGIWVFADPSIDFSDWASVVVKSGSTNMLFREFGYSSPQEAYSEAFDYALKELI